MTTLSKIASKISYPMKKNKSQVKIIHIGAISSTSSKENSAIFCQGLEAMCELGFQVSVLAEGNEETQKCCFKLLEKYPQNFEVLESVEQNRQDILEKSNAIIFTEKPAKKDLAEVIAKNIVPILPEGNGLKDFDLKNETGEAFTFREGNIWSFVSALVRAGENYKFPYDWNTIKSNLKMIVF